MQRIAEDSRVPLTEACQRLGKSWGQVWRLVLRGDLKAQKDGGHWMIDATSLRAYEEQRAVA